MRILLIWNQYQGHIDQFYSRRPGLARRSYVEQQTALLDDYFGWAGYVTRAFRALGHEADIVFDNVEPLQAAWAREHGGTPNDRTGDALCLRQIAEFRPDVLFLWPRYLNREQSLQSARRLGPKIFVWIASPMHARPSVESIDCVLSSFPHFVDRLQRMGATAEFFQPACFDLAILAALARSAEGKEIHVSFAGGLSYRAFSGRLNVLTRVASQVPLEVWGSGLDGRTPRRPWQVPSYLYWRWRSRLLVDHCQGAVYGLGFFSVLHRSRVTLNAHIDAAEGVASNMRLFEATGCGTLLMTEESPHLSLYFEPGREVVTYANPQELADRIQYYLCHEEERARIALAGQQRTLKDHNSMVRAEQLLGLFEWYL